MQQLITIESLKNNDKPLLHNAHTPDIIGRDASGRM
jgi:hypothetical protein